MELLMRLDCLEQSSQIVLCSFVPRPLRVLIPGLVVKHRTPSEARWGSQQNRRSTSSLCFAVYQQYPHSSLHKTSQSLWLFDCETCCMLLRALCFTTRGNADSLVIVQPFSLSEALKRLLNQVAKPITTRLTIQETMMLCFFLAGISEVFFFSFIYSYISSFHSNSCWANQTLFRNEPHVWHHTWECQP